MALLERYTRNNKETSYLLKYASDVTSQGGEDGIIEYLFSVLPHRTSSLNCNHRYVVDIGAWDGKHLSNSYNLLYNQVNWDGLLVEANGDRVKDLQTLYAHKQAPHSSTIDTHPSIRQNIQCVECLVGFEGDTSLQRLMESHNVPLDFDFLSIDVDGNDYHLWHSLNRNTLDTNNDMAANQKFFRPSVVCIEFNPTIPNDVIFIQQPDMRVQQGSSLRALVNLGHDMKYSLVVTTTFNAFFVRDDLLSYLPIFDNSIHSLHPATMSTLMFQTYDGEIKLVGPKKLLWHNKAINPQNFQVLTKNERRFPFAPPWIDKLDNLHTIYQRILRITVEAVTSGCSINMNDREILTSEIISFLCSSADLINVSHLEGHVEQALSQLAYLSVFIVPQSALLDLSIPPVHSVANITNESLEALIQAVLQTSSVSIGRRVVYLVAMLIFQRALKIASSPENSLSMLYKALGVLALDNWMPKSKEGKNFSFPLKANVKVTSTSCTQLWDFEVDIADNICSLKRCIDCTVLDTLSQSRSLDECLLESSYWVNQVCGRCGITFCDIAKNVEGKTYLAKVRNSVIKFSTSKRDIISETSSGMSNENIVHAIKSAFNKLEAELEAARHTNDDKNSSRAVDDEEKGLKNNTAFSVRDITFFGISLAVGVLIGVFIVRRNKHNL